MKRQRVDLFEANAYGCRICPLVFFIVLEIYNNRKSQRANTTIISA